MLWKRRTGGVHIVLLAYEHDGTFLNPSATPAFVNVGAAFVSLGDDGRKVALLMVDGGFAYVHATFDDWLVRAGAVAFPVFDTIFVDEFLCPLERHLRLIVAGCFVFGYCHEVVDAFDDAVDVVHFLLLGFLLSFV